MDVRTLILKDLKRHGEVRPRDIVRATGFSRAYVHRFFQRLRGEGKIILVGRANQARYVPAIGPRSRIARKEICEVHRILTNADLSEDSVLEQIRDNSGILARIPKNVLKITEYAFTEMLNNAIEHSRSRTIDVRIKRSGDGIHFRIRDWGIGIFRNVKESRKLATEMEAIQDLIKGKLTSAPDRHSGEGIFFTSKTVDRLVLNGSGKRLTFDNVVQDVFVHDSARLVGTSVECWVSSLSKNELAKVFAQYTGDEFQFDRTRVTVHLFKTPGTFVSRSQARRMLASLDPFKHIALDFKNVDAIGQGFADEIFRVWATQHPDVKIKVINAQQNVRFMINHVRSTIGERRTAPRK